MGIASRVEESKVDGHDPLIIGTISANLLPEQATVVQELLNSGIPAVTIALGTPYVLTAYPQAKTHLCAYTVLPATGHAVAAAFWRRSPLEGRLPVKQSTAYPWGSRIWALARNE